MNYKPLQEYMSDSRSRLPRLRDVPAILYPVLTPVRVLYFVVVAGLLWMLTTSFIPASQHNLEKFYCFGPAMTPFEMSAKAYAAWHRDANAPVAQFNTHVAVDVSNTSSIAHFDLNTVRASADAANNRERVLILSPLRDAAAYLSKYADILAALTYPHDLIDLAFLVSDTADDTLATLTTELERIQAGNKPFHRVSVFTKDFGGAALVDNLDVEDRHAYAKQAPRRKAMARARNYLLAAALRPEHSWVMWRDVDIVESPKSIIEDFIRHDTDIIVPNVWFHRFEDGKDIEGRFDYNSWVESPQGLALADSLPRDTVIVEGYKEFKTERKYMCRLGDRSKDSNEEMDLDGIGGVSIVVKADVHRTGINFPAYAFENQCETEGFAKMAKRAGYRVVGLPNYIVWHIDTDEKKAKNA